MSLLDHLRELRSRLMVAVWTVLGSLVVCFFIADPIFAWLCAPMNDALKAHGSGSLAITQAMEGFYVKMKVAGLSAVFLASPVLFWQTWKFVGPGLYDNEKRAVLPLVLASTGLALTGGAFAYFVVFRYGFPLFLEMNGEDIVPVLSIDSYLGMTTTLLVAFAAAFQLPVAIYFMSRMGLVNHRDLIKGFRYAVVAIFAIAAVLTPPDVLSQLMMAAPLVVLYGIGIVVSWAFSTKPVPPAA